jgi:hypothetical protein
MLSASFRGRAMERILTLHFIDGSKLSLAFDEQGMNSAARKLKVEKLMASKHLVVEAEGQALIFPVANIKYMALSLPTANAKAVRETLPSHAITGARIRS